MVKRIELVARVGSRDIATFYAHANYSYEQEREFQISGAGEERRRQFLAEYDIPGDASELVLRVFNQVNYAYAQKNARANLTWSPETFLEASNQILLHMQGKPIGYRTREISFGIRQELDRMDVRRRYKALLGLPPPFVQAGVAAWQRGVESSERSVEAAIVLMLAVIAIHPFSDGNGRLARLTFSWLLQRWGLPLLYLREGADGEFLREGAGIDSTEHRMRVAVGRLCDGANLLIPGELEHHTAESGQLMLASITDSLAQLRADDGRLFRQAGIAELLDHYRERGHITSESQSFLCL